MLKNTITLEHKVGDKVISLLCDNDTQLPYVKDALCNFLKYVGQIEDSVKAQQEKAKAEEDAKKAEQETPKPE